MKKLFTILILFSYFCSLTQRQFVLSSTKSPIGTHQLSNPLYRGLPVFNQYIKRNIFQDDKDIFRNHCEDVYEWSEEFYHDFNEQLFGKFLNEKI